MSSTRHVSPVLSWRSPSPLPTDGVAKSVRDRRPGLTNSKAEYYMRSPPVCPGLSWGTPLVGPGLSWWRPPTQSMELDSHGLGNWLYDMDKSIYAQVISYYEV